MSKANAKLELALWRAEADSASNSDLYIWLTDCGLPSEVALRLRDLIGLTVKVGEIAVCMGKIIVLKLIEFVKKHTNLAVGVALGAAFSALIATIPFLGPILAPFALILGVSIGAIAGHRMDNANEQKISHETGLISIAQDVIEIAREFFRLFIETISAVADELAHSKEMP